MAKGGIFDDSTGRFVLPNAREYAAVIARQTQAQNPFASGAYEVMYGGGAAFDPMDGGGLLQEIDESQAYSRLGGVPLAERPIPSDELLAMRMGTFDDPLAPEEREAFRTYIRANPRGTVFEFRNPRAMERMVPMRFGGGSLDELSSPMSSALSEASTASVGRFGRIVSKKTKEAIGAGVKRAFAKKVAGEVIEDILTTATTIRERF